MIQQQASAGFSRCTRMTAFAALHQNRTNPLFEEFVGGSRLLTVAVWHHGQYPETRRSQYACS
jgi:hypothetical protein